MKYTISEALTNIKTIDDRIGKAVNFINNYVSRPNSMKDPLQGDGGSKTVITKTRQSIKDLEQMKVNLRLAINRANLEKSVAVNNETKTVAEWLIWRREVADNSKKSLESIIQRVNVARSQAMKVGQKVTEEEDKGDIIVNVNELEINKQLEHMVTVLGELDGKLSVFNATTTVEV